MGLATRNKSLRCWLLIGALIAGDAPAFAAGPKFDAAAEARMREAERVWADVAVTGDPTPLHQILADDYLGVSSSGKVVTKADQLVPSAKGDYAASRIDYINYRPYGDDLVIAQGAETLTRANGGAPLRLIWIDVWRYRGGRWQIIASQDSRRPEGSAP